MKRIMTITVFAASLLAGASVVNAGLTANGTSLNGATASPVVLMDVKLP